MLSIILAEGTRIFQHQLLVIFIANYILPYAVKLEQQGNGKKAHSCKVLCYTLKNKVVVSKFVDTTIVKSKKKNRSNKSLVLDVFGLIKYCIIFFRSETLVVIFWDWWCLFIKLYFNLFQSQILCFSLYITFYTV